MCATGSARTIPPWPRQSSFRRAGRETTYGVRLLPNPPGDDMPDEQTVPLGPCLEPEVLAAYVERTLPPDERARAEAHLATCEDCYALLTEVMRTTDEMDGRVESEPQEGGAPPVELSKILRPAFGRRRVWSIAGVVLAAALLLVVRAQPEWWQRIRGDDGSDRRLEKLVAAVGTVRTVEGRLTGGFGHGPLRSPARSGGDAQNALLLTVARELQKAAAADPSVENLHAYGVAQLFLGRYDEGVRTLEEAAADQPANGRLQSDLAAAYLARAVALEKSEDAEKALAAVQRALAIDPFQREALFNRALALERLSQRNAARGAWETYLQQDPSSAWADEAKQHLERLY